MTVSVSSRQAMRRGPGFTLIEVVFVLAIMTVLLAVALPAYSNYREEQRVNQATSELLVLNVMINNYYTDTRKLPNSLAAIGAAGRADPWGNPYVYLNLHDPANKSQARKNKNLTPLNSDFDLYSKGKDGESAAPLTVPASRDDVIRANDGRFLGLASDYE
jgi:general secretion pathway protein G